jgi:hypothetical protein
MECDPGILVICHADLDGLQTYQSPIIDFSALLNQSMNCECCNPLSPLHPLKLGALNYLFPPELGQGGEFIRLLSNAIFPGLKNLEKC